MRLMAIGITSALLAGAAPPASADCICRGPGVVAYHGQTVCLRTPDGPRLARCEMVLNNSSWTFLPDPCPQASLRDRAFAAGMSVVTPALVLTR